MSQAIVNERERDNQAATHDLVSALKVAVRRLLDKALVLNEQNAKAVREDYQKRVNEKRRVNRIKYMNTIKRHRKAQTSARQMSSDDLIEVDPMTQSQEQAVLPAQVK